MSLMLIWTDIIDEYGCLKVHKKCVHKHFPRERRWEVSTGWESGSHTAEHTVNTTRGSSDTLQPTHTPKHTHTPTRSCSMHTQESCLCLLLLLSHTCIPNGYKLGLLLAHCPGRLQGSHMFCCSTMGKTTTRIVSVPLSYTPAHKDQLLFVT